MLANDGWCIPVRVSETVLRIKNVRTRKEHNVAWPVLKLSDWAATELSKGGEMFLGGCNVCDEVSWRALLRGFWARYYEKDPGHLLYDPEMGLNPETVIPYMLHGDEGRGRNKQPLLSISFQCLISHYGEHRLNTSG